MKREILNWAYGFFTLPLLFALLALIMFVMGSWFSLPEHFKWLRADTAWAGALVFAGVAVLVGAVLWCIFP